MLAGFGPAPLLQGGQLPVPAPLLGPCPLLQVAGSPLWHNPPATLQLAVVIVAWPEDACTCPTPRCALPSRSARVTMGVNQNLAGMKGNVSEEEGNFLIMRVN